MSDRDKPNRLGMLDAITQIGSYTEGMANADQFYEKRIVFDATLMNFVVLGEMSARISDALAADHQEVEWPRIKAFRNMIAHEYLGIDAEEVWQIVQTDIPSLRKSIERIIGELE